MFENDPTPMFDGNWLCVSYLNREILMSAVMVIRKGRIRRFKWISPEFTEHYLDQHPIHKLGLDEMLDYEDEEHPRQYMNDIYFNVFTSIKKFIREEKVFLKTRKKQHPPEKPLPDNR